MANTFRPSILNGSVSPDVSGNVWSEPYGIAASNDLVAEQQLWRFKDTATKIWLAGHFVVPKNYVGSPKLILFWTATVTTGNVVWGFEYRTVAGDDATSLDATTFEETPTLTDAAPTAAHRLLVPAAGIALTAANFSVDELVQWRLYRDGSSGSDTMAADALLFDALFEYQDA